MVRVPQENVKLPFMCPPGRRSNLHEILPASDAPIARRANPPQLVDF